MPTMEEMRKYTEKSKKEREEFEKKLEELRLKELEAKGIKPFDESSVPLKRCDHPNTMEDSTATVVWINQSVIQRRLGALHHRDYFLVEVYFEI